MEDMNDMPWITQMIGKMDRDRENAQILKAKNTPQILK